MNKSLLIGAAAVAMLASCSNDETVEIAQSKAIGFTNAFVNNVTRSTLEKELTTNNLSNFAVYGYQEEGKIFDGQKVEKDDNGGWTYNPLQYWIAGNAYTFGAIAPASVVSNVSDVALSSDGGKVTMQVVYTNDDDAQIDLLHAAPTKINASDVTSTYSTPVSMTFNHQLSKVKFSFENGLTDAYTVKVSDVQITNAYTNGTLTVNDSENNSWAVTDGTNNLTLSFGNAVSDESESGEAEGIANGIIYSTYYEKLLIPTGDNVSYSVTFTAEMYRSYDDSDDVTVSKQGFTATISGVELKLGYSYNFKATFTKDNWSEDTLNPIEFELVKVEEWISVDDKTLNASSETSSEEGVE